MLAFHDRWFIINLGSAGQLEASCKVFPEKPMKTEVYLPAESEKDFGMSTLD
jgi:hypothetical protein